MNDAGNPDFAVREVEIVNRLGLHARAAARFVAAANQFSSDIQVSREGRSVNGKSIMGMMMLAAGQGSWIRIEAEGTDAASALDTLEQLVAERFGEDT